METIKLIYHKVRTSTMLKKEYVNFILKSLIVLGIGYSLYRRLSKEEDLDVMLNHVLGYISSTPNLYFLFCAFLMIPFLWWTESYRWLILVKRIVKPKDGTLKRSLEAMISGQTLGMFVPYRIGKIGGRVVVYESKKKLELIIINFFEGESIKLLTDIYGFIGATYVLYKFLGWSPWLLAFTTILTIAYISFRMYLYYNIKALINWLSKFRIRKAFIRKARILEIYSMKELKNVMRLSGVRLLFNFLQYYFVMRFFNIEVPFFEALFLISAIYYLIANVPLPALAGLFARIQVAIFIWSHYSDNIISMSSIPLVLWVMNSLLPALVGTYILVNTNLAKNISLND